MSAASWLRTAVGLLASSLAVAAVEPARVLPAGSELVLTLDAELSTKTAQPGDWFELHTAEDVRLGDVLAIPAGSAARGQVIHAQKAGAFGRAAELLLTVREIEVGTVRLPTRQVQTVNGKDRIKTSAGFIVAFGFTGAFVRGGQIVLPAGTGITTRTTADLAIAPATIDPLFPTPSNDATTTQPAVNQSATGVVEELSNPEEDPR